MNLPGIDSYDEKAIDTVAFVINKAKSKLGGHQTLTDLTETRQELAPPTKLSLSGIRPPLARSTEQFIVDAIEKKWKLTQMLKYYLTYRGLSRNEAATFYYFEALFSQPTPSYPIPQATVAVYFRVEDRHLEPPEATERAPTITFRIEGRKGVHDVRFVALTLDSILGVLKMKLKLFKRIEEIKLF